MSCGKTPAPRISSQIDSNGLAPITLDLGTGYSVLESHSTTQFIPKGQGGSITLSFVENDVYFTYIVNIPPNGLPNSMDVTVTVPDPTQVKMEISPTGVRVNPNLTVDVYIYNKTFDGAAETAYWDEVTQSWKAVDGDVTITQNSIEAHGTHDLFGDYAIVGATQ